MTVWFPFPPAVEFGALGPELDEGSNRVKEMVAISGCVFVDGVRRDTMVLEVEVAGIVVDVDSFVHRDCVVVDAVALAGYTGLF